MKKVFLSLMIINFFLILQIGCTIVRPVIYPIGMTQSQIEYLWGPPNSKITSYFLTKDGKKYEEWVYKEMGGMIKKRIIFIDGKATEIKY